MYHFICDFAYIYHIVIYCIYILLINMHIDFSNITQPNWQRTTLVGVCDIIVETALSACAFKASMQVVVLLSAFQINMVSKRVSHTNH